MREGPEKNNPLPETEEQEREENRAWALKWDGAALAAMHDKKGDQDRWDRP